MIKFNIVRMFLFLYREIDYTHGIFQSIGFKEFHEYLILSDDEKDSDEGKRLLLKGMDKFCVMVIIVKLFIFS